MQNGQMQAPPFALATRKMRQIQAQVAYSQNQLVTSPIPKNGYLARIAGYMEVVFTTAATGTYTALTSRSKTGGPTPFNAITRLRVTSNQSNVLYDTTLWANYLINRHIYPIFDPFGTTKNTGYLQSSSIDQGAWQIPSSFTTSTQYTIRCPINIPIALSESLQAGLILTQTDRVNLNLEVQWGNIESTTGIISLTGTTPSITVNSATVQWYTETFAAPPMPESQPDDSYLHVWQEDILDFTANGDVIVRPPTVGPIYLAQIHELVNNSAAIGVSSVTNVRTIFSASQQAENLTARTFQLQQAQQLIGLPIPEGCYIHNYKFGGGDAWFADRRDFVDTANILDYQIVYTMSGLTVSGAFIRNIRETLVPNF